VHKSHKRSHTPDANFSDEENMPPYVLLKKKKAKFKVTFGKFIASLSYLICESSPVEKKLLMQRYAHLVELLVNSIYSDRILP
jgi:hypothetical protein